ncbi:hypothetical protein [Nonomuraea sp. NPDC050783]|uniref:hypothetical protein n=1 Tax=Nonomuraea sp. NPDC050783 TaxID=3154634 RepID=UPI0034667E45
MHYDAYTNVLGIILVSVSMFAIVVFHLISRKSNKNKTLWMWLERTSWLAGITGAIALLATVVQPPISSIANPASTPTASTSLPSKSTSDVDRSLAPTTGSPTNPAVASTPPPSPSSQSKALIVNITMGGSGKVGPNEYKRGSAPGAGVNVYSDQGQLDYNCYVAWKLERNGEVLKKSRNGACISRGFTMFSFDENLGRAGHYILTAEATTDDGSSGSKSIEFDVVD